MLFAGNLIRFTMLLCLAGLLPSPTLAQTIVWTDDVGGTIQRKDAAGGPVTTIMQFTFPASAARIHYDPRRDILYYRVTTGGGPSYFERCNIDGTAAETIPTSSVGSFAINVEARQLCWIDSNTLRRATLDGSPMGSHAFTVGVVHVLEAIGNDLYFMTSGVKAVWRCANLDGSNEQLLRHTGMPGDLAFDPVDQKLYYSTLGEINRINPDGTGFEQLVHLPHWAGNTVPEQIEVDHVGRKLYWLDQTAKLVQRSNLDGSAIEDFVTASEAGNPDMRLFGLTIIQPVSIPALSFGGVLGFSLLLILAGSIMARRRAAMQKH